MSSSWANLEKYRIPLDEILRITRNFSSDTLIGDGGFGMVYMGELTKDGETRRVAMKRLKQDGCQGNTEFRNELDMISAFGHPNIISFIGYCDEANEMIIVSEYAKNGSVDHFLRNPDKIRSLTWAQRLKICLGAARGLEYLHSGLGEHNRVIHRDVKSANILLDDNLDAKICDFGLSRFGARNERDTHLLTRVAGTRFYMDPLYAERSRLTKESDVYSFGVVMFEMSSGALVYHPKCFGDDTNQQFLIDVVRNCYDDGEGDARLSMLIDFAMENHIHMKSLYKFNKIAHECLSLKLKERPTMGRIIQKIEKALNIQLKHDESPCTITTTNLESHMIPEEEINLAIQKFNQDTQIKSYEHGVVHIGQLYGRWQNRTMAITRLYPKAYQREHDFRMELRMISSFQHKNISPFIGYCYKANERVIVQEYGVNGCLADYYTEGWKKKLANLSWAERLKICLGAARGLQYLHLAIGKDNEAICGNITCENILLDETMEAKISFFGLSIQGRTYQKLDKQIPEMESFGVILFEMVSGHRAEHLNTYVDPEYQINQLQEHYNRGEIFDFTDNSIRIDSRCLEMYMETAYRCIMKGKHVIRSSIVRRTDPGRDDRRPRWRQPKNNWDPHARFTMDEVVAKLEECSRFEMK